MSVEKWLQLISILIAVLLVEVSVLVCTLGVMAR